MTTPVPNADDPRKAARARSFGVAVTVCAVAAAIALYVASRTWLVEVVPRLEPLPPETNARTGGSLVPVLPALALVALAGAGGLLATRGRARQAVGALLVLVGLAIPASLAGVVSRPGVAAGWLVVSALCGLLVAGVGVTAIRRTRAWPSMGTRYERAERRAGTERDARGAVQHQAKGAESRRGPGAGAAVMWDALDRGEDPTRDEI